MVVSFSTWTKYLVILGVSAAVIGCALPSGDDARSTSQANRVLRLQLVAPEDEPTPASHASVDATSANDTRFAGVELFDVAGEKTGSTETWTGKTLSREQYLESSFVEIPLVELSEGMWVFSITGLDGEGETVFEGSTQVQLREADFTSTGGDAIIPIPIQLLPLDGEGTFTVALEQIGEISLVPADITFSVIPYNIDRAQGSWRDDHHDLINQTVSFPSGSLPTETTVPAGYYELRFTITDPDGDEVPGGRGVTGFRVHKGNLTNVRLTVTEVESEFAGEVIGVDQDRFLMVSHTVEVPFNLEITASYTKYPDQPGIVMAVNAGTNSVFDSFSATAFRWLVNGRLYNVRTLNLENTRLQPVDFGVNRVDVLVNPLDPASSQGQREAIEELLFVGSTLIEVLPTGGLVLRIDQDMKDPVPITIFEVTNAQNGDVTTPPSTIQVVVDGSRTFRASVPDDAVGTFEWFLDGISISTNEEITVNSWSGDNPKLKPGMNQLTVLFRETSGTLSSARIALEALY